MAGAIIDKDFLNTRRKKFATIAKQIVYDHWVGVEVLTAEPLEHGLLRGPAVRRVLRSPIGEPPRTKPY